MEKKIIYKNLKEIKDYKNKYDFSTNLKKNKLYSKERVEKAKKGKFYKINDHFYVKLPRLTRNIRRIIVASLAALLIAGSATTVAIFYMPHPVTLKSNYLEIKTSNKARLAHDYKCTFKIKDDVLPIQYMNNIRILSVKVNGNEIPVEDYSFIYQTNAKNELTINKKHLNGNIEINADLVKRESKHNSFWFEFNIANYSDFDTLKVTIPQGEDKIVHLNSQEEYQQKFIDIFDLDNPKFHIVDNVLMNPICDVVMIKKGTYEVPAKKFKYSFPYDTIVVREDNAIRYDIQAKTGSRLPKNMWLRSNARFTRKDEDFFLKFSSDYKKATLEIPYFFIRDNGSININPDMEDK